MAPDVPSTSGVLLGSAMDAQLRIERARFERSILVHLTALFSLPLAALCAFPVALSQSNRALVLFPWAFAALSAAAAHASVRRWVSKRDATIAELRGRAPAQP